MSTRQLALRALVSTLASVTAWCAALPAAPIATLAGGKPRSPIPMLDSGLTFFGLAESPAGRRFAGGSGMVFEVTPVGLVRVAGCGLDGYAGDGGPALEARFLNPTGLAADGQDRLYIADAGNFRVRHVDLKAQTIETVAGNGLWGPPIDGAAAADSPLGSITALWVGPGGELWIADATHLVLLRVDPATSRLRRVAGTGIPVYSGDGLPAELTSLGEVVSLLTSQAGDLWLADATNLRLLQLGAATGTFRTLAGGGMLEGLAADGLPATEARLLPLAIARDGGGNIYLADGLCSAAIPRCPGCPVVPCPNGEPASDLLRIVDGVSGVLKTVAGGGAPLDGLGDGGPPREALLGRTGALLVTGDASLFLLDGLHRRIRALDLNFNSIRTAAGNGAERFSGDGGAAIEALLARPHDAAAAPGGEVFIADTGNDRIRVLKPDGGVISTLAGGGSPPDGIGDGLPALQAALRSPLGLEADGLNTLWIADAGNRRIRRLEIATGIIRSVAGQNPGPEPGDGGPAEGARLRFPVDVAVHPTGEYWISDRDDGRIRKVDPAGTITTFAGGGTDAGEDVPAGGADLARPGALALDPPRGRLYLAEEGRSRVRVVDLASGRIRTVAGSLLPGPIQAPLPIEPAGALLLPAGLLVDRSGSLLIADAGRHQVLHLDLQSGLLRRLAGTGIAGDSPDGTEALLADLRQPAGLALDRQGELLFAERGNHRVRRLSLLGSLFAIQPAEGSLNGGYAARIGGQGFVEGLTRVLFDGIPSPEVKVLDPLSLTAAVPAGQSPARTVEVVVETPLARTSVPGGFTYLNDPPVADADPDDPDDGYLALPGAEVLLDGSASRDPNEVAGDRVEVWLWDFGADGTTDAIGPQVRLSPAEAAVHFPAPGIHPVLLQVADREGLAAVAATTVEVVEAVLTPRSGSVNGGYPGEIAGSGLARVTEVRFGKTPVIDLKVSEALLAFTVPVGPVPVEPVAVTLVLPPAEGSFTLPEPFTYENGLPVARAAPKGAYRIRAGDGLVLDGTASTDPNFPAGDAIERYEWDLDGDGSFDRRGAKVLLAPEELTGLGLDRATVRAVTLRITDRSAGAATDQAEVTVEPRPAEVVLEDYRAWVGDADGDELDDKLEARPDSDRADLVVVLDRGTDLEAAARRLEGIALARPLKIPAISAICLKGVLIEKVRTVVAIEPALFRAEEEVPIEADLDVSAAAIRARPSFLWSPDTAHDLGFLGSGINLAFLDSGIDDDHPAFAGKFVAGFNVFTDDPSIAGSQSNPDDDFEFGGVFHGTHVAGVAVGSDPLYSGVAPAARLIDVKVLNQLGLGSTAGLLVALQWCIDHRAYAWAGQPPTHHGIDVVNLSVSSKLRSDGKDSLSMMVDAVVLQGLVVVASAGNSGEQGPGFGAPAAADLAITVAAVDDRGTIDRGDDVDVGSSNFGPRLDDGDSNPVEELKPDVTAPGVRVLSPTGNLSGQPASGFTDLAGSSAAAAHAAGAAALMLEAGDGLSPGVLKNLLRNSAEPRGVPHDSLLDPTYNVHHGKGLVDAFRALPRDLRNANVLWAAQLGDDNVSAIVPDPASSAPASQLRAGSPHPIAGGRQPFGIAVDGKGSVWLANRRTASVSKLNAAGGPRLHLILAPLYGANADVDVGGIAVDAENDAWLTLTTRNRVIRIRANGTPELGGYPVGSSPVAVAADRSGNIWTANSGSGSVTKLGPNGVEAAGSPFAVGTVPSAIVCGRSGRAYVANRGSDTVTILEPDGTPVGHFPAGTKPVEIALDFAGNIWVANDLQATVTRLDPAGGSRASFNVGAGPRGISVAGDGTLWVSIYTVGIGNRVVRLRPDGFNLEAVLLGLAPLNHGDGTGFVHASSVDPSGDADGDGISNAEEIDLGSNPFDRASHLVEIASVAPPRGSVNGGNGVLIQGRGLDGRTTFEIGGAPASLLAVVAGGVVVLAPPGSFPPAGPVDVLARGPDGGTAVLAGGYEYLNDPPIADVDPDEPDDGYSMVLGDSLTLDGRGSTEPNAVVGDSIVDYLWDVNGHPVPGANPTLAAGTLAGFGIASTGLYLVSLRVADAAGASGSETTTLRVQSGLSGPFIRGQINNDRDLDLADAVFAIQWLFLGGPAPTCLEAADANFDRRLDLADPVYILSYFFLGGARPPAPFPACGSTPIFLGCVSSSCP